MKPARLGAEFTRLEDRTLPTTFGVPWADPEHLTLSFVADGTPTPLGPSTLAQTLGPAESSAAWQREVLRAFQTWAANANIDIGLVADGGQPLGAHGAVQGDSRFGDVRVAAAPLSAGVVASASPFSWTGTTFSGDVVLNAAQRFAIGDRAGAYDVYSVALHEAGHVFGIGHADGHDGCGCGTCTAAQSGSVMDAVYGRHVGLAAEDVAAIQALYGARTPDQYDAAGGNNSTGRATVIPGAGLGKFRASGDLTTMSDVDYYKFTVPPVVGVLGVVVRLKASGVSLLTPSVTVTDANGRVVGAAVSTDPLSNDLTLRFNGGLFGGTYFVKVDGAQNDVFGVGGYHVAVDYLSLVGGILSPVTGLLSGLTDGHTDDLLGTANHLEPRDSADARFDVTYRGVIEDATDTDTYRIGTKQFAAGTPVTLNVMAWAIDASRLDPRVRVFDAAGNPVAFQVLANDRGLFSVQVPDAVAGRDYFVQVAARSPGEANGTGSYFLAADFNRHAPAVFDAVASGTVAADTNDAGRLTVTNAGLFQFALAAELVGAGDGGVTMSVYDADGRVVFTLSSVAGQPAVTSTQYLRAGTYTVRYTTLAGKTAAARYGLFLMQLSEGVGPYATTTGSGSQDPGSGTTSGTGTTTEPTTSPTTTDTRTGYAYSGSSRARPGGYGYTF